MASRVLDPLTFPPGGLPIAPPWNVPSVPGQAPIRPPNVANLPPLGRFLSLPLPEDSPIPTAQEFHKTGNIANAGVVAAYTEITGCTMFVPAGSLGVVRAVTAYITSMLLTTDVNYFVQIDGANVQGYDPFEIFPRVASSISNSVDAKIRLKGPCTVRMAFTQVDGGAYTIGGTLDGWIWAEDADKLWKAVGPTDY